MKILLIGKGTTRIPPESGIPVTIYMHTLAKQLTLLGNEVDVICPPAHGRIKQTYNMVSVGNPGLQSRNIYLQNLYEIWFSLCFAVRFRRLYRKRHYNVVHFFENPFTAFAALLLDKRDKHLFLFSSGMAVSGTKLNWGVHDKTSFVWRFSMVLHEFVFKNIPHVTVSSEHLKKVVVARTGTTADKIIVTPFISAETDIFNKNTDTQELRQKLGLNPTDVVVLCLAPVAPYKNQFSLVKAIPSIIQKHPATRFVFVGDTSIPDYYAQILKYIRDNSLGKYVTFTGFIKNYADLFKYYNLADVYVLLSRAEGNMPKTTLDAMSCRKAIVVSNIPQNREGTARGDEMLLVDPDDIVNISKSIMQLVDDPGLRQHLGENARRTIDEYHTPEVVAKRMVQVYERIKDNL